MSFPDKGSRRVRGYEHPVVTSDFPAFEENIANRNRQGLLGGLGAPHPAFPLVIAGGISEHLTACEVILIKHRCHLGFPPGQDGVPDITFVAEFTRAVEHPAGETVGEVLLGCPVLPPGMGILVTFAVTECMLVPVGIPQVTGHSLVLLLIHRLQGIEETQSGIGFRAGGQIESGVGEMILTFRQAYPIEG